MPSSASGYGVYQQGAVEPFNIESTLAEIVGRNNPDNAANLLGQYHQERLTSTGNYNYEMDRQHRYAYESLAAQMADANMKNILDANKDPGGLDLLANQGVNIDPVLRTRLEQNKRMMQIAQQAQHGGAAAASLTAAGAQPQQQGMDLLSGGTAGPVGLPEAERVAHINAAASGARGGSQKYMSVPFQFGVDSSGNALHGQVQVPVGASDAEIQQRAADAQRTYRIFYPQGNGLPGATPPGGVAQPAPQPGQSVQKQGQTNLTQNPDANRTQSRPPPQTQSPAQGQQGVASPLFLTDKKTQSAAQTAARTLPPDQKKDVAANIQSGTIIPVVRLPDGRLGFVGKSNKTYAIP